jgi:hypothetical protein
VICEAAAQKLNLLPGFQNFRAAHRLKPRKDNGFEKNRLREDFLKEIAAHCV